MAETYRGLILIEALADLSHIIGLTGIYLGAFALGAMGLGALKGCLAMPDGPGSISLRSTEPLRVSAPAGVTIPIALGDTQ